LVTNTASWTSRARVQRRLLTASGAKRDILWFSVALRNENGDPDGLISIGQDITDQLRAQAERASNREEIEKLARVLTLGELATTFAHELSQPIAAILSNAQTLEIMRRQSNAPRDESDEVLGDILRDTRRARNLMQRVRAFMFNEEPQMSSFDIGDAIDQAVEMLSAEAARRGVRLIVKSAGEMIPVTASFLELQQVLMNLILNAIQASGDATGGRVEISWEGDPDGQVMIAVDDSGPGLDVALKETVFHPFVTSKAKGTGIGLAVAKRIVERHGGAIAVKESPIGGARFEMILPIGTRMQVAASG
jgi:two-component system sensor histidine kinase DctS